MPRLHNFIDYRNRIKQCGGKCGEKKPFNDFYETEFGYPTTQCKVCKTAENNIRGKKQRMKAYPEKYWVCACGEIYSKRINPVCKKCNEKIIPDLTKGFRCL